MISLAILVCMFCCQMIMETIVKQYHQNTSTNKENENENVVFDDYIEDGLQQLLENV